MLSPAIAAAQQTTLPMIIAAAGPFSVPSPISSSSSDDTSTVAIVTPDMGLLDEPTRPAMYPATAENKKPVTSIINAIGPEMLTCSTNT